MSDPQGEDQPITDEQRKAVRKLMFALLRVHTPDIDETADIFEYRFIMPTGNVIIRFEPGDGFIDWAITTLDSVIRQTLDAATETLVREGKLSKDVAEHPKVKLSFHSKNPIEIAAWFAYITMQNLIPKMKSAFVELGVESRKILESIVIMGMEKSGFDQKTGFQIASIKDSMIQLSKELASKAQTTEKSHFLAFLYELCSKIEEPSQKRGRGRPRLPLADRRRPRRDALYSFQDERDRKARLGTVEETLSLLQLQA